MLLLMLLKVMWMKQLMFMRNSQIDLYMATIKIKANAISLLKISINI